MLVNHQKQLRLFMAATLFGLPLLLWASGDVPRRWGSGALLSLLTFLAFGLSLGSLFLTRGGRRVLPIRHMGTLVKLHKVTGAWAIGLLLLHPLFLVLPRLFVAGLEPGAALGTLVENWENPGLFLGIIAWFLMLLLGVTSFWREELPIDYRTWRRMHGVLAVFAIVSGTFHGLRLGRSSAAMLAYMIVLAVWGVLLASRSGGYRDSQKDGSVKA